MFTANNNPVIKIVQASSLPIKAILTNYQTLDCSGPADSPVGMFDPCFVATNSGQVSWTISTCSPVINLVR